MAARRCEELESIPQGGAPERLAPERRRHMPSTMKARISSPQGRRRSPSSSIELSPPSSFVPMAVVERKIQAAVAHVLHSPTPHSPLRLVLPHNCGWKIGSSCGTCQKGRA